MVRSVATYVSTWQGWMHLAFVIDVFARRIVGRRIGSSMRTDFVLDALEQALYARPPERDSGLFTTRIGALDTPASGTANAWRRPA
jgi:transposase InsO family protein